MDFFFSVKLTNTDRQPSYKGKAQGARPLNSLVPEIIGEEDGIGLYSLFFPLLSDAVIKTMSHVKIQEEKNDLPNSVPKCES